MNTSASVPGPDGLPPDVSRRLRAELAPDERVRWCGQPIAARRARSAWVLAIFGVPWTAFAVVWTLGAASFSVLFALFGLPFVAVGVGLLMAPTLARRAAEKSVYAVTNERVVVIEGGFAGTVKVRSYHRGNVGIVERREHADGSGDLIFVKRVERDSDGDRRTIEEGLFAVRDVRAVERHVRELVEAQ